MLWAFGMKVLGWFGVGDSIARRFAWVPPLIVAALLLWLAFSIATSWFEEAIDTAKEAGAAEAVSAGHEQTLDQLEDANNAEEDLRRADERDARRYADCLLDSRDKAACERFNPQP